MLDTPAMLRELLQDVGAVLRCAARARSASTASAAASTAAPTAIRAICQPDMPPLTMTRVTVLAAGGEGAEPPRAPPGGGRREAKEARAVTARPSMAHARAARAPPTRRMR